MSLGLDLTGLKLCKVSSKVSLLSFWTTDLNNLRGEARDICTCHLAREVGSSCYNFLKNTSNNNTICQTLRLCLAVKSVSLVRDTWSGN